MIAEIACINTIFKKSIIFIIDQRKYFSGVPSLLPQDHRIGVDFIIKYVEGMWDLNFY